MPCNCKRSNKPGQVRRTTLPNTPMKFNQVQFPQPDLPTNQPAPSGNPSDNNTLDAERRRIEKLRRDAVRRSLGIG